MGAGRGGRGTVGKGPPACQSVHTRCSACADARPRQTPRRTKVHAQGRLPGAGPRGHRAGRPGRGRGAAGGCRLNPGAPAPCPQARAEGAPEHLDQEEPPRAGDARIGCPERELREWQHLPPPEALPLRPAPRRPLAAEAAAPALASPGGRAASFSSLRPPALGLRSGAGGSPPACQLPEPGLRAPGHTDGRHCQCPSAPSLLPGLPASGEPVPLEPPWDCSFRTGLCPYEPGVIPQTFADTGWVENPASPRRAPGWLAPWLVTP